MESLTLTNSMKNLIDKLAVAQAEHHCSDEFLITLNKLIATATDLTLSIALTRDEITSRKKQRLHNASSSSEDVRYISNEHLTVTLDSDSDESVQLITTNKSTTSNASPTPTVEFVMSEDSTNDETLVEAEIREPMLKLKRLGTKKLQEMDLCKKKCVVRLRRINGAGSSSAVDELNRNIIPANGEVHSVSTVNDHDKTKPSGQVSQNENISDANSRPLGQYTYEDYLKRYSDVCSVQ